MPKKWESDWDYPEGEFDEEIRNRKLLTLGNLTILSSSLNTAVRNSSWSVKKSGQGTRLGLNHFATGLDTFSQYLNESIWDEDLIQKRADFLYEAGRNIWPN